MRGAEVGQIRDDHVVTQRPRLRDDLTIGVEHHRVAGADLIVVRADAVAEEQKHAVVVRPARQPAHEPRPALGAD